MSCPSQLASTLNSLLDPCQGDHRPCKLTALLGRVDRLRRNIDILDK